MVFQGVSAGVEVSLSAGCRPPVVSVCLSVSWFPMSVCCGGCVGSSLVISIPFPGDVVMLVVARGAELFWCMAASCCFWLAVFVLLVCGVFLNSVAQGVITSWSCSQKLSMSCFCCLVRLSLQWVFSVSVLQRRRRPLYTSLLLSLFCGVGHFCVACFFCRGDV